MTHKAPQWARPTLRRIHSVLEDHPELGLEDEMARLAEWLERQPAMKQRSEKRVEHMKNERIPAVQAAVPGGCQICPEFERVDLPIPGRCPGVQGIHERRKSSSGGSRVNPDNLIPCCNRSNGFIEDHPLLVHAMFGTRFVVREGDEEWSTLSKRNDRM